MGFLKTQLFNLKEDREREKKRQKGQAKQMISLNPITTLIALNVNRIKADIVRMYKNLSSVYMG